MELEQIVIKHPQLNKVTDQIINDISLEKFGYAIDYNKTFGDNGFDDLDCIELVMEIERKLDIVISDDLVDLLFNTNNKPPRFQQYWRNKKLEDLGL
jgi:acyl carrier protein